MAMNPYVGWSVTTLLSWLLNRNSNKGSSSSEPEELSTEAAELGTPVPVVMGRSLVKSPLTIYYGGFKAKAYTETYSAHAKFSAWPVLLTMLLEWALKPKTGSSVDSTTNGHAKDKHTHSQLRVTGQATLTGQNVKSGEHGHDVKETEGPNYLMALATWLLSWLINGRNLKTTMQKGFKYYLGYQMLCCVSGEGIRLRGIYMNEQEAWTGDVSRKDYPDGYSINVDDDELFGGPDENGGFSGDIRVYLGGAAQPVDPWMVEQMSVDSVQEELRGLTPAYRPFVSIVVPVAYIGKQASIPQTWLDLQWIPNRLGLGGIGDNDANPAEIIYELHVNNEWGLGRDPVLLDVASLKAIGQVLKAEGRGVTVKITSRDQVKTFIDNLCDHLDMVRYTDPQTGKLTFKLIRDDYNVDDLLIVDQAICSAIDFTRTVWASSVGEIVAKYTDRASLYDTSTVMVSDPAIIEANDGDRNSQDMDFTYFTTSANAAWAANRELRQQGFPLASAKLTCNRKAYALRPGDVFKLNWAPYGISDLVMRVSDIDLGDFVSGEITLEAIEDVFGVGKTTYGANDTTSWTKPETYPTGVQLFHYFEAPWELLQSKESYIYAAAVQPDNVTAKWNIWRHKDLSWLRTNGMTKWTPAGQLVGNIAEFGEMVDMVGFTIIDLGGVLDLAKRSVESGISLARSGARIIMIDSELMGWGTLSQLANGNFKVSNVIRATHDTVPASHAAGATVYFLDYGYYANVTTGGPVCGAGTTVSEQYNITTATTDAEEEFSQAKITALTTVRRSERPTPPGRIRMTSHLHMAVSNFERAVGDVRLFWAIRNKSISYGCVSQDDIIGYYTGQSIEAAEGLQTVIRAYSGSTLIHETVLSQIEPGEEEDSLSPITPTTYMYTWAQRCLDSLEFDKETTITISSRLNDLESYQVQSRTFVWQPPVIVDACATTAEAQGIISSIVINGSVLIAFTDVSLNKTIPMSAMPLIVLGTVYETEQTGAILARNGKWVVPNGTVLAITGAGVYSAATLTDGYVMLTYFNPDSPGDLAAYQFTGTDFKRIAVPAL